MIFFKCILLKWYLNASAWSYSGLSASQLQQVRQQKKKKSKNNLLGGRGIPQEGRHPRVGLIDEHRKHRENREHPIKILYRVLLLLLWAISWQVLVPEQSIAYQNVLNFNKESISRGFYTIHVSPIAQ